MVTKEHITMLERMQRKLSSVPDSLPYNYVVQCYMDAEMMTDVINLCIDECAEYED